MRYLIFLFFSFLLITSCGEDSFSTTVDIPLPKHDPLPAISLDIRTGDTTVFTRVSLSRGIVDQAVPVSVEPTLTLLRNGAEILSTPIQMPNSDGQTAEFLLQDSINNEEAIYELELDFPGFDQATAVQRMPSSPIVSNLDYEEDGAIDTEGFRVDKIEFDLADDPNTEDYYGFRVLSENCFQQCITNEATGEVTCTNVCTGFFNNFFVLSPDPTLKQAAGFGLVMTDKAITGNKFRVRLTADSFGEADSYFLEVSHITEDAYRYGISRLAYQDSRDNPFAEPVNVHTNVEQGYGHFIMANRIRVPLE